MASRIIDIRLGSSFDPKGVVAAETQIQILEKESAEAAKETADSIKSSVSAISSTMSTGISSVDKYTTSLIKQLDATRQLAVAEKELEKQRAIASGDSAAAARADEV